MSIEFITAAQVAAQLGVHDQTIYKMAKLGILPHTKVGRRYRFTREGIERWMREQEEQSKCSGLLAVV